MRRWRTTPALLAALLAATIPLSSSAGAADEMAPQIETIAGGIPNGRPATEVSVVTSGFDFDALGNLYVADPGQGVVWRIEPDGTIHHVAGMGRICVPDPGRCVAEGGPASEAFLGAPAGVAVGPDGSVYVAEMRGHRVRRVDPATGVISTYAGNGTDGGYTPDHEGAQARDVAIWMPQSLAVDSQGRLFVASLGHRRIYRVDPDGTLHTAAGCGSYSHPTCSTHPQDGSPVDGSYIGANAGLNGNGWGLAVNAADELFIADTAQILKLDEQQQIYRVVAGKSFEYANIPGQGENGPAIDARFSVIVDMDFAPGGDLYLMEGGGSYVNPWNRIQRIEAPVGPQSIVRHVGGLGIGDGYTGDGGPAGQARFAFSQPTGTWTGQGMAVGPNGDVFVGDIKNARIRRIDGTGTVTTSAGNGRAAPVQGPWIPNDQHPNGTPAFQKGLWPHGGLSGDAGSATQAQLFSPTDVEVDHLGNVYLLDGRNGRVRRVAADGTITTVAGGGCVGAYCGSTPLGDGGPATAAGIHGSTAIALDRTGTQLYIADERNRRVRQVNLGTAPYTAYPLGAAPVTIAPGEIETVLGPGRSVATPGAPWGPNYAGCGLVKPYCGQGLPASEYSPSSLQGLATDSAGNLYFSDAYVSQVLRVEQATGIVTAVAGLPHTSECSGEPDTGLPGNLTQLCGPTALAFGPDGDLYVAETSWMGFGESLRYIASAGPVSSRIRRIDLQDPANTSTLIAGGGAAGFGGDGGPATDALLAFPRGIAVAPDGTVYVSDTANNRIRRVAPDGTITTVAGAGEWLTYGDYTGCDLAGDGGPAADALLCQPHGIALGADGTLYVADSINNRVRAIRGL